MKYVMEERQDVSDQGRLPTQLSQTTEEIARSAVAAAAAVRPRPSIVVSSKHQIPANTQKWRRQLQKFLHWSPNTRERERKNLFNPELLTRQKRQWNEMQLQALEKKQQKQERPCFFDHFVVVGLHPSTNVEATEVAFAKKKAWQKHPERAEWLGRDGRAPPQPTLEPQVLFKYPPGKRLPLKSEHLPAFCFPSGVEARLMERTPSMSELNEVMYAQSHQNRDDQSFIFLLKVADNVKLYGVCVLVPEIVQRLPSILAVNTASLSPPQSPPSRFLVSAPRCYCFLTRLPFFNLHVEVLNSIIAQERLDRITQCVNEMSLAQHVMPTVKIVSKETDKVPPAQSEDDADGWMDSAIPLESVLGATAAAAGIISEKEVLSFSKSSGALSPGDHREPLSPTPEHAAGDESFSGNGIPEHAAGDESFSGNGIPEHAAGDESFSGNGIPEHTAGDEGLSGNRITEGGELHSEDQGDESHCQEDDLHNLAVESQSNENGANNGIVPGLLPGPSERQPRNRGHERMESSDSLSSSVFESSVRSNDSDYDAVDGEMSPSLDDDRHGCQAVLAWAEANNNESLRIVCAYHRTPVPARGTNIVFQPLEHLQAMHFSRLKDIPLSVGSRVLDNHGRRTSLEVAEIQAAVTAGEEAVATSIWATATLCRALSLENVMAIFAGALLEKQMVVICPNLGVLSAVVMAVIPMIRPYEWQSILLPILPDKMLEFLEAPVPFIVGVQHKTSEVRARSSNLIRVNVYKDKVTSSAMPQLPRYKELVSTLEPHYTKLAAANDIAKRHPIFECNDSQAQAAEGFLAVVRNYLESLCMDLWAHTITNVQSNDDKVSLLLKESFVESFAHRDRPFMKLFAETQQFSVYTDAALSNNQYS